ncbi:hypothetical protein ABT262_44615, partial [Amycolatopsis mediterranei]
MPLAVFVLGLSVFALGTSEFMITGLLPGMAADLHVSIPDATRGFESVRWTSGQTVSSQQTIRSA